MQIGIGISLHQPKVGAAAAAPWLLDGGTWNDDGVWDDSAVWYDSPYTWTNPNLATASYDSVSLDVSGQDTFPRGIFFKDDGLKLYLVGDAGNDVNEYNLSTAWDVSTATHSQVGSVSTEESQPSGLFFKADGTKMYISGFNGDEVNEYNLTTAWDVSTLSHVQNFSVATEDVGPTGLYFNSAGTKMYITGFGGDEINGYTLSTAWNISTASHDGLFSLGNNPAHSFFNPDGNKVWVLDNGLDDIREYDLSTAFDVTTMSYSSSNLDVSSQATGGSGLFIKPDGSKIYVTDVTSRIIYQYST
jgi:DNA-binding beta-propeller fold protein YncE